MNRWFEKRLIIHLISIIFEGEQTMEMKNNDEAVEIQKLDMDDEPDTGGLTKIQDGDLRMVAGGASCSGHTWEKVQGNLYRCTKCGSYQWFVG